MNTASAPAGPIAKTEEVKLTEPVVRGETTIETLLIRKPKAGELRGLSLQELMNARVSSTLDLLPRITTPPITQAEADNMEAEDIAACAGVIIGFFLTPADKKKIMAASKR